MNHLKKSGAFLIVLLTSLLLTVCAASGEDAALTIMVYMCGSDLESAAGAASADLDEMISAMPSGSVRVVVMTGGSAKWHKEEIQDGAVQIHRVDGSGIVTVKTLDDIDGPANMGDPATLIQLIDYSIENEPADAYALVLWDHGSGPMGGVCADELHDRDGLTLEEIRQALADSILSRKLRWIGFDACLMGSLEVACAVEPYAETMIASQGTEPGSGWNYSFLRGIEKDSDGNATGKRIVDAFFTGTASPGETLTMSCVDLGKIPGLIAEMDRFFGPLAERLTEEDFPQFYSACSNTTGFARAGQTDEPGLDLVDLGGLARSLDSENTGSAGMLEALDQAVILSRSSGGEVSGLSVYHPLQNTSYYMASWRNIYERMNVSEGYREYITAFGKQLTSGSEADWSGMQTLSGSAGQDGQLLFALPLTEAQAREYASGKLLVLMHNYRWDGTDNGYALVAVSPATLGEDGLLYAGYDGRLLYAENAEGETFGPLSPTLRQDGSLGVRAIASRVIAAWDQEETRETLLYILEDDASGDQTGIERILIRDEAAGVYSSRLPYDETRYGSLRFYGFSGQLPDLNGEIPAFYNWIQLYSMDDTINLPADWHFKMTEELSAGEEMIALFEITDIHGVTRCSRPTALGVAGKTPVTITNPVMGNSSVAVAISGELVDTQSWQGLELKVDITNRTNETEEYRIWDVVINGTKEIRFEFDRLALSWDVEGNQTQSGSLLIDAAQLAGIDEIRDIRFDLQVGRSFENRGEIRYEFENCDISWLTDREADRGCLAETTVDGIHWQLLGIRMDDNGDLDLSVRIRNGTGQEYDPFAPNCGVDIGGVQLDGNYFNQKIKVASGETQDYTFHLTNTIGEYTVSIDGDWGYDQPGQSGMIVLTDRFLQRHGIREIRNMKFYMQGKNDWIPIEFSLETPWPVPDDGRQRQTESWTGAMPEMEAMDRQVLLPLADTEEYSLKLERVYVGRSGVGVCVEAVNKTDRLLELKLQDMRVNDQPISHPGRNALSILPGVTSGWILCSEYAVPGGTAVETISFTVRCTEEGSYDPPAVRDQVASIRLPENSITGNMNGKGIEAETCEAESGAEPVPEEHGQFEPETRYVCVRYQSGTYVSMLDSTDYLGNERFIIFHGDGHAEYLIDSSRPKTDWWAIREGEIVLYDLPLWTVTREENTLVFRKNREELTFVTETEAASMAASVTPTPAPQPRAANSGKTDGPKLSTILLIAAAVLIVAGVIRSRKKKQSAGATMQKPSPKVPQNTPSKDAGSRAEPASPRSEAIPRPEIETELLSGGRTFYALYLTFENVPFVDASYRIWLFTSEGTFYQNLETHLPEWKIEARELKLLEIKPEKADRFFFTVCYQYGISEAYVDREEDIRRTARYTSEPAEKYDGTKPNHTVTNPVARRHILRFTQLVRSQYGAENAEKGKEYTAAVAALKDAEVLLLAKQTGSGMTILKGTTVSGRNVNTVYTDFEAIPKDLWEQGVRTGLRERMEDQLRSALKEQRTIAVNLNSNGGGIFLDESDIRKMLNTDQ